ncbi:MAG: CotH kinase family protein [Prevotella sp.]|nr:CotH kinase family protein [Prevotella sp.]
MRVALNILAWWMATAVPAQPRFSLPHGLYDDKELTVAIEPTEKGAEVRYTTDGSKPMARSKLYTKPLTLTASTILRAIELGDSGKRSAPVTATYILTNSIARQGNNPEGYPELWGKYTTISGQAKADYEMDPEMTGDKELLKKIEKGLHELPILSIVSDKDNFFSHTNDPEKGGIYIFTGPPVGDTTGHGWTRPCCVELFGGPQQHDFTIDCGVRLHGGHGRLAEKNPKHSFRLVFKKDYGPGKLEYPLFGEDEPAEFDQLVLRCHFGNSWQHWMEANRQEAQYTRDLWMRRMQRKMGRTSVNAIYVHLFLNGMYWGLYNLGERVDDLFGKQHLGGKKSDIDVVKIEEDGGYHLEASEGTLDAWDEMLAVVEQAENEERYQQLDTLLDIDHFIDYMLINQYAGNTDWDKHNWYAIRRRGSDSEGFRFLCWDSEVIFERVNLNLAAGSDDRGHPTTIFLRLLKNDDFARRYVARAKQLLADDGLLGETSVVEVWDSLYHTISIALYDEAARWGDYRRDVHRYTSKGELYTVDDQYMKERKRLLTSYFPQRSQNVLQHIFAFLPEVAASIDGIAAATTDERYYNLQGLPVEHPTRGIYIKNGKKVVLH